MKMQRSSVVVLFVLAVAATAPAQTFAEAMAQAQQEIEAQQWERALAVLLALQEQAAGPEQLQKLGDCLDQVGDGLKEASVLATELKARQAAVAVHRRIHGDRDDAHVARSLNGLAICLSSQRRADEALPQFEAGLAMWRRIHGDDDDPSVAANLFNVASCLVTLGRAADALPLCQAALAMRQRLHGDGDHPEVASSVDSVAYTLESLGRSMEALPKFQMALAMHQRLAGNTDQLDVAFVQNHLAQCLQSLGRPAEALPQFEAALAMRKRLFGNRDHRSVAASLNNLAQCLQSLGRLAEALLQFEAELAMRKRLSGDGADLAVASSLDDVAQCLGALGREEEALPKHEAAVAMYERLYGNRDHRDVAGSLTDLAICLQHLGREADALSRYEAALAMDLRIHGDRDDPDVAWSLTNVAGALESLGRAGEALAKYEAALAVWRRLHLDQDHPEVAKGVNNVAFCLQSLGRADEALPQFVAALAMRERLFGSLDHADMATSRNNVARSLESLGRAKEALPHYEAALAMWRRLHGDRDHELVALGLSNVAGCLRALGRTDHALPRFEAALAMRTRLYGNRDHAQLATNLDWMASCLQSLGRAQEALPPAEAALAMRQRLYGDHDHPDIASSLSNMAFYLQALGRIGEALPKYEAALAILKRIYGDGDHPDVARCLSSVASCLPSMGRAEEALMLLETAFAMKRRIYGDRDHPDVASSLTNVASCLRSLGRGAEALLKYEAALAMRRRLYGDRDHPDVARGLNDEAQCLASLDRAKDALVPSMLACDMIERLRDDSRISAGLRQSLFDELKRGQAFEQLQMLAARLGRPDESVLAAERSRGRDLLDLFEQQRFEPMGEAARRTRQRGDDGATERLEALRSELEAVNLESDRLLHVMTRLDEEKLGEAEHAARRLELLAQSNQVSTRCRQLLDERARLLGDVLPVGRVRTAREIQAALQEGELFLEFTVTAAASYVYVLAHDGQVEAIPLPSAFATVQRTLPDLLSRSSRVQLQGTRGRNPEPGRPQETDAGLWSRELFDSLIPKALWPRLQSQRRVFIAPHRDLHRLPFELLVVDSKEGKPVYWLDAGPGVAYVPSGSALHWLRQRAKEAGDDTTQLDLLAVGDPGDVAIEPDVPEGGAFVVSVQDGGEGARAGLRPRDVVLRYDGAPVVDDTTLRDLRTATEAAIEDGKRPDAVVPLDVWRRGETLQLEVKKGLLGIQVGKGKARMAYEASIGTDAQLERVTRAGDLERLRKLPPLRGARAETQAIEDVFTAKHCKTKRLLGAQATEPAVFDLAAKAKYLHFACHGVAEEYAGQSLSMLVLTQPENVLPEDDGLLQLNDLLHRWRGRLSSCRLVVLSACRTNVGPSFRDDAPQALPLGFLFGGASSVISSLWAVDDESTRALMTDFYQRLLAGEQDRLEAFTAAKKALRAKYQDPFHWAPFLYMGSPQ